MKTKDNISRSAGKRLLRLLTVVLAHALAVPLASAQLGVGEPETDPPEVPRQQQASSPSTAKTGAADVFIKLIEQAPDLISLFDRKNRTKADARSRTGDANEPPKGSWATVLATPETAVAGRNSAGKARNGSGADATAPDSLVAPVLHAQTLTELRAAMGELLAVSPDPAADPAVLRAAQNFLQGYTRGTDAQRRVAATIFRQLLTEDAHLGTKRATLLCIIRTLSLQIAGARTPAQVANYLSKNETDLLVELNDRAVAEALAGPAGLFRAEWVQPLKQVLRDWKAAGAQAAAERLSERQSSSRTASAQGSASGVGEAGALIGNWTVGILGEATGMSHQFYYTFHSDGSYEKRGASVYSFGPAGGATGKSAPVAGQWSIEGRVLRLTSTTGQATVFQITSASERNMITRRSNGDRWLWEKKG